VGEASVIKLQLVTEAISFKASILSDPDVLLCEEGRHCDEQVKQTCLKIEWNFETSDPRVVLSDRPIPSHTSLGLRTCMPGPQLAGPLYFMKVPSRRCSDALSYISLPILLTEWFELVARTTR
jgi:hypothetical protein